MGKLRLTIDNLKVDSFTAGEAEGGNGTVRGHDTMETEWCTGYPDCVSERCGTPYNTCYGTCGCTKNCETHTLACG